VLDELVAAEGELHAPALLDVEVAQVLRRLVRDSRMTPARGEASIEILQDLPITRHPMDPLLPRIWQLRDSLTAYDAANVALAEALGSALLTCDRRLLRASPQELEIRAVR